MNFFKYLLLCAFYFFFAACVNTRPIQYVEGTFDTARLSKVILTEPVVQIADIISITVFSDNPAATLVYNQSNTAGGYLVDDSGNIQMQGVGQLHVAGLTKFNLTKLLKDTLSLYLKNPYFNIRFINYKITLLGEVNREGGFTVPSEKVTIFEAIGLAGGLTIYAKRNNVTIVREVNGRREFARVDLTSPEIFNSPYYFLKQNDLVLVEQTRTKLANTDQTTVRNISIATSLISTLVFLYTVFR